MKLCFQKLTATLFNIFQDSDASMLRITCVHKYHGPLNNYISLEDISKVKESKSLENLFETLADSPQCNCID